MCRYVPQFALQMAIHFSVLSSSRDRVIVPSGSVDLAPEEVDEVREQINQRQDSAHFFTLGET